MAATVQGMKAGLLLESTAASFLHHLYWSTGERVACVALPPCQRGAQPPSQQTRGRGKVKETAVKSSNIVRSGRYIVNPSRYPSHMLQAGCHPLPNQMREGEGEKFLLFSREQPTYHPAPRVPPLTPSPHLHLPSSITSHQLLALSCPANLAMATHPLLTFSPPTPDLPHPPHPSCHDDRPTPAQLAFVLLKLREEIPAFFDGAHSTALYAADMQFENSLGSKSWTVQGSAAYSALLSVWRVSVRACFSQAELDLLKISKDVESGKIEARWRARGRPRAPWRTGERIIVEAFSTFHVRADGNIAIHKVDKVIPGGKEPNRVMSWLARVGVALIPSPPQPSIGVTRTSHDMLPHNA